VKLYIFENEKGGAFDAGTRESLLLRCAREYCGMVSPDYAGLCVTRDSHGKPYFAKPLLAGVHFSISHSGRYWAALFARTEVGLDIEDLSVREGMPPARMASIAERFFAADEIEYIGIGDADDSHRAVPASADMLNRFFRVWTAKESYIKYTGRGISEGLASFSSMTPPDNILISTPARFENTPDMICSYCRKFAANEKTEPAPEVEVMLCHATRNGVCRVISPQRQVLPGADAGRGAKEECRSSGKPGMPVRGASYGEDSHE
jgi:phosphopantetheinyl transferase